MVFSSNFIAFFMQNVHPYELIMSQIREKTILIWKSNYNVKSTKFQNQGRIQAGAHPAPPPPPKIGKKIWCFRVKSWFFTRNTEKKFPPRSARRDFFKVRPPSLKSWIRPWEWSYSEGKHLKKNLMRFFFLDIDCFEVNCGQISSISDYGFQDKLNRKGPKVPIWYSIF